MVTLGVFQMHWVQGQAHLYSTTRDLYTTLKCLLSLLHYRGLLSWFIVLSVLSVIVDGISLSGDIQVAGRGGLKTRGVSMCYGKLTSINSWEFEHILKLGKRSFSRFVSSSNIIMKYGKVGNLYSYWFVLSPMLFIWGLVEDLRIWKLHA